MWCSLFPWRNLPICFPVPIQMRMMNWISAIVFDSKPCVSTEICFNHLWAGKSFRLVFFPRQVLSRALSYQWTTFLARCSPVAAFRARLSWSRTCSASPNVRMLWGDERARGSVNEEGLAPQFVLRHQLWQCDLRDRGGHPQIGAVPEPGDVLQTTSSTSLKLVWLPVSSAWVGFYSSSDGRAT